MNDEGPGRDLATLAVPQRGRLLETGDRYEFLARFEKRKVSIGTCARAFYS